MLMKYSRIHVIITSLVERKQIAYIAAIYPDSLSVSLQEGTRKWIFSFPGASQLWTN